MRHAFLACLLLHAVGTTAEGVVYDFAAGDTLAAKGGWTFAEPNWALTPLAGGKGQGLPFQFTGTKPGNYGMREMRFTMPPADAFWLGFRWHIPADYHHRHDTHLDIVGADTAGWQIGDEVRGTVAEAKGVISQVDAKGVFLRYASRSYYNESWVGGITNLTRTSTLPSTGRSQWGANNKLLAIWADGYSAKGLGPTLIWQTDLHWGDGRKESFFTVGYSAGNHTVSRAPATAGVLVSEADRGKFIDIIFHGRFCSKPGAKDGVIRSWVRREGEKDYRKHHDIANAELDQRSDVPAGQQQWCNGYLMGWANSGFDRDTTFHMSRLTWSGSEPAELSGR